MTGGVEAPGEFGEFDELMLMNGDVVWVGGAACGFVEVDEVFAKGGDIGCFSICKLPSGSALDGGAEGSAFCAFEADGFCVEDGGADLPPDRALATAAGEAHFAGLDAEVAEALHAVSEAEGDPFHGGARHECGGHGFAGESVENAGAIWEVWGSFAGEVGEEEESFCAGWSGAHGGFEGGVVPVEQVSDLFGGNGHVHGANEGHPLIVGVAERGDFSVFVDDGF